MARRDVDAQSRPKLDDLGRLLLRLHDVGRRRVARLVPETTQSGRLTTAGGPTAASRSSRRRPHFASRSRVSPGLPTTEAVNRRPPPTKPPTSAATSGRSVVAVISSMAATPRIHSGLQLQRRPARLTACTPASGELSTSRSLEPGSRGRHRSPSPCAAISWHCGDRDTADDLAVATPFSFRRTASLLIVIPRRRIPCSSALAMSTPLPSLTGMNCLTLVTTVGRRRRGLRCKRQRVRRRRTPKILVGDQRPATAEAERPFCLCSPCAPASQPAALR